MPVIEETYSGRNTLRNALHFLMGKAFSALSSLALLALIVRYLPIPEYGLYVAGIAALELGLVVSALGIDWAVLRYVPLVLVNGSPAALRRFLLIACSVRLATLLGFAGIGAAATFLLAPPQTAGRGDAVLLLAGLFISEGILRLLRDNVLESLASQKHCQLGIAFRNGFFLALICLASAAGVPARWESVLAAELAASLSSLGIAILSVRLALRPVSERRATDASWRLRWSDVAHTALNNYAGSLLNSAYSLQSLLLLVAWLHGSAAAASFGFVVRLIEMLRGYLPAMLLMNVIRPRIFGIYELHARFEKVLAELRVISRISFLTLFPLIVLAAWNGDQLVRLASSNRFSGGTALIALIVLFMAALVFRIQRQVATLLLNCVHRSGVLVRSGLWSLAALPVFIALIVVTGSPLPAAAAVLWDEIFTVFYAAKRLADEGFAWSPDGHFMLELAGWSLLCFGLLRVFPIPQGWVGSGLAIMAVGLLFLFHFILRKPLGEEGSRLRMALWKGAHHARP